ncbi:zinc finger protein 346-like [Lolium rigidum]|uniref:zinc finger protein 346-like n=1 Tax=Lolium rigidum TaxID=89674 RepID=UPI001F5D2DC9|nr:zinc finger protein 346-like [Lolium rigidum]
MDYAAHAAAAPPAADPHPPYAHPYGYPYTYPPYHQPDPAAANPPAASSSYYYSNPTAPADAQAQPQAQYNPYAGTYHYYDPSAVAYGGGGLAQYYFSTGEASQAPPVSAPQPAPAPTGGQPGKHFGFDPQRYAQVAAAKAPNGVAPEAAATVMHHAQWNAHFGHPLPRTAPRKFVKKIPKVVQPLTCEVCKIECDTQEVLLIHKTGKKHKKNLQKLQDSITPKPAKPLNGAVGASTAAAPAVADGIMPAVQPKKNKSSQATPEDLEVKKRKVLEAGAAQGEVKICTACNVVVNSQKVYEFHIAGHKHKANVQKQQHAQLPHVA